MGKSETLTGTGDFKDKDKDKDREKDKDKIKDNFKEMDREMRLLCISNPRGQLSKFNQLAEQLHVDGVIVAGNFGFYDNNSYSRLTKEELLVCVENSELQDQEKQKAKDLNLDNLRDFVKNNLVLSELPEFISGEKSFKVPVYVVCGSEEDLQVIEEFDEFPSRVPNLFILDEKGTYSIGRFQLLGLGGGCDLAELFNVGEGKRKIAGRKGSIWTTLIQIGEFLENARNSLDNEIKRIFISHVDQFQNGLFTQIALDIEAEITISGTNTKNDFNYVSVCEEMIGSIRNENAIYRIQNCRSDIMKIWEHVQEEVNKAATQRQIQLIQRALDAIYKNIPTDENPKKILNINLPSLNNGNAILVIKSGAISLETHSTGRNYFPKRIDSLKGRPQKVVENPTVVTPMNPPFKCFLRDVPEQTTEQDIRDFFSDCKILQVQLNAFKKFYSVEFEDSHSLEIALKKNNMKLLGAQIGVEIFKQIRRTPSYPQNQRPFKDQKPLSRPTSYNPSSSTYPRRQTGDGVRRPQ